MNYSDLPQNLHDTIKKCYELNGNTPIRFAFDRLRYLGLDNSTWRVVMEKARTPIDIQRPSFTGSLTILGVLTEPDHNHKVVFTDDYIKFIFGESNDT